MCYRNIKWKGIDDGLEAFAIAKKKFPDIRLLMYGKDKDSELPSYVEFHKNPSNDELRKLYNSCDIFLFSSLCEGFGMPPMEAMACKCAVVTTNVGAVPDYAIDGKTALVSPPGDIRALAENIVSLVKDEALLKQISAAGYDHIISNFNWNKSAKALEQVFKETLAKNNPIW
jgi:hypothetical protein